MSWLAALCGPASKIRRQTQSYRPGGTVTAGAAGHAHQVPPGQPGGGPRVGLEGGWPRRLSGMRWFVPATGVPRRCGAAAKLRRRRRKPIPSRSRAAGRATCPGRQTRTARWNGGTVGSRPVHRDPIHHAGPGPGRRRADHAPVSHPASAQPGNVDLCRWPPLSAGADLCTERRPRPVGGAAGRRACRAVAAQREPARRIRAFSFGNCSRALVRSRAIRWRRL